MPGTIHVDKRHTAPHVLARAAVFPAQQYAVGAAIIVNDRETRACLTTAWIEQSIEPMTFVRDLHSLERRSDEAPRFVEISLKFFVRRHHAWVAVRHVDDGAPIKIRRA